MSDYNQDNQGNKNPKGHEPHPQGSGQNPPPKPGQQEKLPDQDHLDQDHLDSETQEQLRKDNVENEQKGLIHQLPGGESG
jgi:hypothetical protein